MRCPTSQYGPLRKSAESVTLYLRSIAYVHRLQTGVSHLGYMLRVKLLLEGARLLEGPPRRKPPIYCDDIIAIKMGVAANSIREKNIFYTILIGWYFVLRKKRLFGARNERRGAGDISTFGKSAGFRAIIRLGASKSG